MKRTMVWAALLLCAGARVDGTLDLYFLDMAGGASTLIVTPAGESVLIDTGWLEAKYDSAERIVRAARDAGLERIDVLVTTHFDIDHYGCVYALSQRIPIGAFYDKGYLPPSTDGQNFAVQYPLYLQAGGGTARALRPGDTIGLRQADSQKEPIRLRCVAAQGRIDGFAGDINQGEDASAMRAADRSDNVNSIALLLTWGQFAFFAGGDITWNLEHHLAEPKNVLGQVDLYQVTHHGLDMSNNPRLLRAIEPLVCVAMNGPRKGIGERTFANLKGLASVEAIYQIHYNAANGQAGNTAAECIANYPEADAGRYIRVRVDEARRTMRVEIEGKADGREYRY